MFILPSKVKPRLLIMLMMNDIIRVAGLRRIQHLYSRMFNTNRPL